MTVSVSDRQSSNYSGPQSSGHEYEFSFRLHDASMLYVEITDDDGVKTEADPNDYSVTLNYDQYGNPGGIVTYDLALPYGSFLRVISRLEIQQQSELTATPSYVPRNVEDALDYLAMTMQDQGRAVEEAVNVAQDAAASAASASANAASAAADADAAASAAADSEAAAELLSVLQDGTPTNEAIAEGNTVLAALWKLQGQANAKLEYKYIGTWDGKPAASTLDHGDLIFVTDYPAYFGSVWIAIPLLGLYIPQTGNLFIAGSYDPYDSDNSGTEQILQLHSIPAAFLLDGLPLDFDILISKSGTTDSATIKLRMGTAGDLADPVIATFSMSAAQRKLRLTPSAQITSSTTINCQPELATDNASNNAWLADVTIPDISNALTISLSVQLSGTTDTATVQSFHAIQRGLG